MVLFIFIFYTLHHNPAHYRLCNGNILKRRAGLEGIQRRFRRKKMEFKKWRGKKKRVEGNIEGTYYNKEERRRIRLGKVEGGK